MKHQAKIQAGLPCTCTVYIVYSYLVRSSCYYVLVHRCSATFYKVLYYVLSSHGDGHVYNADGSIKDSFKNNISDKDIKLEFDKDQPNRAKVYISVNSHALYGAPGSYIRFGGAGNDNTSKGKVLDPEMLLSTHPSLSDAMAWTGSQYATSDGI